ncbi:MAG: hypothetical protein E7388_07080 [Ruminococcaceae bacterium]|nr:hypothetical protein [Oscillospiraceae bacterium]
MNRRLIFFVLSLLVIFALSGCKKAETEIIDIGENPIHVQHAYASYENINKNILDDVSFDALIYDQYESMFKGFQPGIILECEVSGQREMVKFEADRTINGYRYIEKGNGDYLSVVITPVKVLKVHYKGPMVDAEINQGDIIPYVEDFFMVTEDMDEVTDEFLVGDFVSIEDYYPMLEGHRYLIHGGIDTYQYKDIEYEIALFPYRNDAAVCLSENGLHAYRRELYTPRDMLQYIGTWIKYGESDTFEYIYAGTVADDLGKINTTPVYNLNSDKKAEFFGIKEKNRNIVNLPEKNGVAFKCNVIESGQQVENDSGISSLKEYEYFTKTKVQIEGVCFKGDNVPDEIATFNECYVYEPYFSVTKEMKDLKEVYGETSLVTYSGYYPIMEYEQDDRPVEFLLYCTVEKTKDGYVLVPMDNSPAIPDISEELMDIPLHMQVQLGPEGVLNYLETYLYHCVNGIFRISTKN